MNKNIGIILPSMEISQLAYEVITTINQEIMTSSPYDYRIFFEELSIQCVQPLCATMNVNEIWGYNGLLISTTLENTMYGLNLAGNVQRVFYIWDMEWLRNNKNYLQNLSILRHPSLMLISRSEHAAKELENYSNRRPNIIMPRLTLKGLMNEISKTSSTRNN